MHTKRTARHFKPIAKNKQDHWIMWDGVMKRKLTSSKLQRIQQPELYYQSKGMMCWPFMCAVNKLECKRLSINF